MTDFLKRWQALLLAAQVSAQAQAIIHAPGRSKAEKLEALTKLKATVDEYLETKK